MTDIALQGLGLVLLVGGVAFGYRRWIAPYAGLTLEQRGLLLLILLTSVGGSIGAVFWWFDERRSFAWDLPPLASRLLAVAGWAFATVSIYTLQHPLQRRLRLSLWLLVVYLAPLALAILFFHLQRFDFAAPLTYAFFIIVGGMVLATLWYLGRALSILATEPPDPAPVIAWQTLWLISMTVVLGVWGLALFITDAGFSNLIWVWPGDLLTSRLIGVMLLTLAVGAAYSARYLIARPGVWAMLTIYGLGAALAAVWNTLANKPVPIAYLVAFGIVGVVSAVGWWREMKSV